MDHFLNRLKITSSLNKHKLLTDDELSMKLTLQTEYKQNLTTKIHEKQDYRHYSKTTKHYY